MSEHDVPGYSISENDIPDYGTLDYDTPEYDTPEHETPEYETPEYGMPGNGMPENNERVTGDTPDGRQESWWVRFRPASEVSGPPYQVRRGTLAAPDGQRAAVARKLVSPADGRVAEELRGEIEILLTLWHAMRRDGPSPDRDHPYPYPAELVRLICYGEGDAPFLLTTSLPGGETLGQRLRSGGWLGREEGRRFAASLLLGLYWLHTAGIVHRDLTPENILWDGQTALILDFSHACWAGERRLHVDTPPWSALDPPRDDLYADHTEDVSRACLIILHLATGQPPEALAGLLDGVRGSQSRDDQFGPGQSGPGQFEAGQFGSGQFDADPPITTEWFNDYFFSGVFRPNSRVTAGEMLKRLGLTQPAHRTRRDPAGMVAGLEQFRALRDDKERRRTGRNAPSQPSPSTAPQPWPEPRADQWTRYAVPLIAALVLVVVVIVGLRGL